MLTINNCERPIRSPELSSFSRACTAYAREGECQRLRYAFQKCRLVHYDFEKGSQNQHFQSTFLVGMEGLKKNTLYMLLIM